MLNCGNSVYVCPNCLSTECPRVYRLNVPVFDHPRPSCTRLFDRNLFTFRAGAPRDARLPMMMMMMMMMVTMLLVMTTAVVAVVMKSYC
ncbi:hypothetical protein PoB_002512300 [Plakobranchus ocellatus]|uniref:Uncharacterized protein n=1 Tax=Plakobranchus ocellatus TaxID=259542 RepID=A0AAV3ZW00_9GAST|nr:hypothetical protein PoB_002512300 [Plakobranchus ocellatus]